MNDKEQRLRDLAALAGFGGAHDCRELEGREVPTHVQDVLATLTARDVEEIARHNGPVVV